MPATSASCSKSRRNTEPPSLKTVKSSSGSSVRRWKPTCTAAVRSSTCSSCSSNPRASRFDRSLSRDPASDRGHGHARSRLSEAAQSFLNGTAAIPKQQAGPRKRGCRRHQRAHRSASGLSLTPTPAKSSHTHATGAASCLSRWSIRACATPSRAPNRTHCASMTSATSRATLHPSYVIVIDQGAPRAVLRRAGDDMDGPTAAQRPQPASTSARAPTACSTPVNRSGRSPGMKTAPSTGSRTRSPTASQPREMLAMAEQTIPVISPRATSASGRGDTKPPRHQPASARSR